MKTSALPRIMSNLGGSGLEKRQLLMRMVRSIALYAAPIWAEDMDKNLYRIGVDGLYRRSALRVVSAFRTVSADAALVIAEMVLIRMLVEVEGRKYLSNRKTGPVHPDQLTDDLTNRQTYRCGCSLADGGNDADTNVSRSRREKIFNKQENRTSTP